MTQGFTVDDGSVLFGLLADGMGDVLLKTDASGFIVEASPSLERLGVTLSEMLVAPHLSDLARSSHTVAVREYCMMALSGSELQEGSVVFPARGGQDPFSEDRWFSLSLRSTMGRDRFTTGAIAFMRAIERRELFEGELLSISLLDEVTGLSNRSALMIALARVLASGRQGSVIMFGIDRFRAITLRYGRRKSDEVLWAFSQFLRAFLGEDATIARLDEDRFAVVLPSLAAGDALELARSAIETFTELASDVGSDHLRLTASAGIAPLAGDCDEVLFQAELSLVLSQAAGGARADLGRHNGNKTEWRQSA